MHDENPSLPGYWDKRYASGQTPWDFGGVPVDLGNFLQRSLTPRVLIPGCGSGHEVKAFIAAGYDVTALDISPVAVERAKRTVGAALAHCVQLGDFFTHDLAPESFDLIYERTFVCALTPDRRTAYRDRCAQLLKRGGSLTGYFYYQNTAPDAGPPFGFAWGEADELFSRYFILTKDVEVNDSLPLFAGRERWQERRRTSFKG
ncbi:methyltransferase domain-containing protein [Oleiharenicola lentus]|uniref:methyltransferase domain-containing protein n=1 Tax=Oleiharenicola lentus TaxID=2508720 RepID=UPI003F6656F4